MRQIRKQLMLAAFGVIVTLLPGHTIAQDHEVDVDRPGGNYATFGLSNADPALCKARCLREDKCVAWTYVKPGVQGKAARCWLKSTATAPTADSCCVSGLAPLRTPPVAGQIAPSASSTDRPDVPPETSQATTPSVPPAQDEFDSTSYIAGDPFDGGEWRNARNEWASAARLFSQPVCLAGLQLESAGTDVNTNGSTIRIVLHGPAGSSFTALDIRNAAINRAFSPGSKGNLLPPQSRSFAPFLTSRIEVSMVGHGWFLVRGLRFTVGRCS